MRRKITILTTLRDLVTERSASKAAEAIEQAQRAKADANADAVYHHEMAKYYEMQVAAINPHEDWWRFASVRQKLEDERMAHQEEQQRYSDAAAKLDALVASNAL